jgi:hypothetical protein
MPTTIESNHPDYKTLLYQLVDFLIEKRLSKEGKGINRPISIPLSELKHLLSYASGGSEYDVKVTELKDELLGLAEETNENEKQILIIKNPEVLEGLSENIEANKNIILAYTRKAMEKYKADSFEGDALTRSRNKLIFDKDKHAFIFNNKSFTIRKSKQNVRLNLCLLMYGHKNLGINQNQYTIIEFAQRFGYWSTYDDYKPGEDVELDFLKIMLLGIEDNIDDPRELDDRPVTDAILGLNKRAEKEFGRKIFKYSNRTVRLLNR